MNQRRHMTVIAAIATLLGAAPLNVVFQDWTWAVDCVIVVAAICGTALAARALRAPIWAQPLATFAALLLVVTWLNRSGHEFLGVLPSAATFRNFATLLGDAGADIRNVGIPTLGTPGLLMLTTAGIGLCAVVIDFVTVALHKPALAGLPLLAIYAVPVAVDTRSVNLIPFVISACGYMWLLVTDNIDRVRLFGRRFTGDGRGVDMWEPSPLAAVGRRIAVVGMALAIIVPVAAPGMTKGFFDAFDGGSGGGGQGTCQACTAATTVDLLANLSGQLTASVPKTLATVKTTDLNHGYLRLGVATLLTNNGFLSVAPSGEPISQGIPNPYFDPSTGFQAPGIEFSHEHASVILTNLSGYLLPVYPTPLSGTLTGVNDSYQYDADTGEVFSNESNTASGVSYSFDYERATPTAANLRTAPSLQPDDPNKVEFTKVPEQVTEVNKILTDPALAANGEYDRVLNLYLYFSAKNNFVYDLSTKSGDTGTQIGDFLTQRRGYCVQYAAALAWLVRAAGYPARVAFGFTEGVLSAPNTYEMTNQNLHAWTEVYFPNFGWVPFDATPASNITGASHPAYEPDPNASNNVSTGPSASVGPTNVPGGGVPSAKPKSRLEATGPAGASGKRNVGTDIGWYASGLLLLILVLLLSPVVARALGRRRRSATDRRVSSDSAAPGEPYVVVDGGAAAETTRTRVHAAWDEFIDTLVDFQVPIDLAETPRTAAERIATTLELPTDVTANVRMLGAAEERARYAPVPGRSQPLTSALRSIRRALASRVSFGTRLRANLFPPSVTRRWRAGSIAWWAQTVARSQVRRDRILRMLSVRRWLSAPKRAMSARGR